MTTPGGNSGNVVGGYTYDAVPTVSSISPASGPLSGTTGVVISGTGFGTTSDTVVVFNGTNITPTAVSSTSVTFDVPSTTTAGTVDVSVTTPGGNSGNVVGGYTYENPDSITGVTANGNTFGAGVGFPTTGFSGATFTINLASSAPSNYTWTASQNGSSPTWMSVSNAGVVTFNSSSQPSSGSVTITATPIGGGTPLTYSFTLQNWFVNNGTNTATQANAASYCTGLDGYSQPTQAQLTNASLGNFGTRGIGNLWSEWGSMGTYGSGWQSDGYWSSTTGGSIGVFVDLDDGYAFSGSPSGQRYVACVAGFSF